MIAAGRHWTGIRLARGQPDNFLGTPSAGTEPIVTAGGEAHPTRNGRCERPKDGLVQVEIRVDAQRHLTRRVGPAGRTRVRM
eukprot:scaffold1849_cov107-Isochrysis_galbana.AAC.8